MSDFVTMTSLVKTALLEVARNATVLGTGLQNVAPANKTGQPNASVQYLLHTAENLTKLAKEVADLATMK